MSYDLDLFTPQAGLDPISTIQQAAMNVQSANTSLNQAIARRLEIDNPKFHLRNADDLIEIMDAVEGIKISLYHHGGHIAIPYWYTDNAVVELAFQTARQYVRLILSMAAYTVYDPQLGRVVDMEVDLAEMIMAYKQSITGMQSFFG